MVETAPKKLELARSSLAETEQEGDNENNSIVEELETHKATVVFGTICCLLLLPLIGGITYLLLYMPRSNGLPSTSGAGALEGISTDNSNEIVFQPSIMIDIPDANDEVGNGFSLLDSRASLSNFNWGANTFLTKDQRLYQDNRIHRKPGDKAFYLQQQADGNLVLYDQNNHVFWSSGIVHLPSNKRYWSVLQDDGNLVTYSKINNDSPKVEWASNKPSGIDNYNLVLTPSRDGLMIARRNNGQIIWSSRSGGGGAPSGGGGGDVPAAASGPAPSTNPADPLPPITPWPQTVSRFPAYSLQSGPLIGHTAQDYVKIWVYLGRNVPMQLVYWPYSSNGEMQSVNTVNLHPDSNANGAAFRNIGGLRPNTTYLYEVRINNQWLAQGHFKTAPRQNQATSFKYLLASCMDVKSNRDGYTSQPVWNAALKRNIDFAMLPGDTVYLNNEDLRSNGEVKYDRIWYRTLQQRAEPHFAHLIKTVPTYGSWDNNDYGSATGNSDQRGKGNSLAAWRHLWPNPYQGSSKGAGNYYSYSWGDVDFFVMDCRWYRNGATGTLFGNAQLAWLFEKLIASSAKFKVIVAASGVLEVGMLRDIHSIGRVISQHRISGVLFNSGDIHRNQFRSTGVHLWPYPLVQITSSGIAKVWRRPFALITINTHLQNPEILAEFYAADSSARSTTWSNNPNLQCRSVSIHNQAQAKCTQRIRLSDLTPR
ncbi:unnamed protein product [Cylindrotheca closterium]|uniref:Bulb-type lectin domain-containing protein n=1 Tax=Cylindrotheca closterium TaxID=2856 RepID=A0AAD2FXX9_9STRA|nr:unnamed protein product [Cylindrotheca closterium]